MLIRNSKKISNLRITTTVFFMLACFAAFTYTVSLAAVQDETKQVIEVLMKDAAAFESGDMATLNKIWANDDSVTVFEQGHANYGWADYRDHHLAPELKEMKNIKYKLSDIRAKVAGTTAWATFKYSISADLEKRHIESEGLGTAVLEKRGGQWLIVHWHTSAPRKAPAASSTSAPKG